jgi:hypothetical protein
MFYFIRHFGGLPSTELSQTPSQSRKLPLELFSIKRFPSKYYTRILKALLCLCGPNNCQYLWPRMNYIDVHEYKFVFQFLNLISHLIFEDSRSHNDTPQSVGFLWTSDRPVAETST